MHITEKNILDLYPYKSNTIWKFKYVYDEKKHNQRK